FDARVEAAEVALLGTLLAEAARDVSGVVGAPPDPIPVNGHRERFGAIIGGAPAMQELYALLDRVARSDSTVLVQGENGTGEDLYYRINVINLMLPSLRQRKEDIPVLVGFFLDRQKRNSGIVKALSTECLARMQSYPWPGNVRELENEIERLVVLSGEEPVIQ